MPYMPPYPGMHSFIWGIRQKADKSLRPVCHISFSTTTYTYMLCFSRLLERSSGAWLLLFGQVDLAKLLLILQDIIVEGHQKALCVLGSHHYAAANLRLLHTGKHTCEVEDEV